MMLPSNLQNIFLQCPSSSSQNFP